MDYGLFSIQYSTILSVCQNKKQQRGEDSVKPVPGNRSGIGDVL